MFGKLSFPDISVLAYTVKWNSCITKIIIRKIAREALIRGEEAMSSSSRGNGPFSDGGSNRMILTGLYSSSENRHSRSSSVMLPSDPSTDFTDIETDSSQGSQGGSGQSCMTDTPPAHGMQGDHVSPHELCSLESAPELSLPLIEEKDFNEILNQVREKAAEEKLAIRRDNPNTRHLPYEAREIISDAPERIIRHNIADTILYLSLVPLMEDAIVASEGKQTIIHYEKKLLAAMNECVFNAGLSTVDEKSRYASVSFVHLNNARIANTGTKPVKFANRESHWVRYAGAHVYIAICLGTPEALTGETLEKIVKTYVEKQVARVTILLAEYENICDTAESVLQSNRAKIEEQKWKRANEDWLSSLAKTGKVFVTDHTHQKYTEAYERARQMIASFAAKPDYQTLVVNDALGYLKMKVNQQTRNNTPPKVNTPPKAKPQPRRPTVEQVVPPAGTNLEPWLGQVEYLREEVNNLREQLRRKEEQNGQMLALLAQKEQTFLAVLSMQHGGVPQHSLQPLHGQSQFVLMPPPMQQSYQQNRLPTNNNGGEREYAASSASRALNFSGTKK